MRHLRDEALDVRPMRVYRDGGICRRSADDLRRGGGFSKGWSHARFLRPDELAMRMQRHQYPEPASNVTMEVPP